MQAFVLLPVVFMLLASAVSVRSAQSNCYSAARDLAQAKTPREIQAEVSKLVAELGRAKSDGYRNEELAHRYCILAELMKRVGDPQAARYYQQAITTDPSEPEYRWLFGDYYRSFRGPQQALFPQAEDQYHRALEEIQERQRKGLAPDRDKITERRVIRSLVALYERDGLPLLDRIDRGRPFAFLSSQNTIARLLTDVGEVDEVRDFTSEALFASSGDRLNRSLSREELRGIIRGKEQFDTLNRLRVRYMDLPVLDVFFQHRKLEDAQITNFFEPGRFNDVKLNLWGASLEKPLDWYPLFDVLVRGEFRQAWRKGVIEFLPDAKEEILSGVGKVVLSRFVGPDKVNLETSIAYDDIDQEVPNPIKRKVLIIAPSIRYQFFRPLPLFGEPRPFEWSVAPRNSEVFAGVALNTEKFGEVDVKKQDLFLGVSIKHMSIRKGQTFDITIQPTLFTSEREGIRSTGLPVEPLGNRQYRTFFSLLYRLYDRENDPDHVPDLAFLNLVLLGSHDLGVKGPKDFENFKIGAGLDAKFIIKALQGGTTFLASARYEFQRFFRLDKGGHLFLVNLSMGF
jgi:hypothetical protein